MFGWPIRKYWAGYGVSSFVGARKSCIESLILTKEINSSSDEVAWGRGACLIDPRYHVVLAVKVCALGAASACGLPAVIEPVTAALRRGASVSGNPARAPETVMSLSQTSLPFAEQPPIALDALHVRERDGFYRPARTEEVVHHAQRLLAHRVRRGATMSSPQLVKDYLSLQLAALEHEVFVVVLLDAQHRLIAVREMFRGSVTQTSVYPREVVKEALLANAAAVILAHNHPSGLPEPSRADEFLTQSLKTALALVDVRVLDHVVVAAEGTASFAERGLL